MHPTTTALMCPQRGLGVDEPWKDISSTAATHKHASTGNHQAKKDDRLRNLNAAHDSQS